MSNLITRRVLVGSLLATFASAATAQLPIMRNGLQGPQPQEYFARLIERSLQADPTGRVAIPEATESFVTPLDVWETLHRFNPDLGPTFYQERPTPQQLQMMVAYIRTLRLRRLTATSRFFNTTVTRRGGNRRIVYENIDTLGPGVEVLVDSRTDDPVFKRDCGNGLGQCVYIDFEVKNALEFQVLWERFNHASDHCFAWRRVSRRFQNDTEAAHWNPVRANRICSICSFDEANRVVGRQPAAIGSIPVRPGLYQFRLIRNERVALCLKARMPHARYIPEHELTVNDISSSFTVDISWRREDYRRDAQTGEEWHALVYYESQHLRDERFLRVELGNGPKSLVWYASNDRDEAIMRQLMYEPRSE